MKGHLTSDEIAAWTAGERGLEAEEHLGECPRCRGEIESLAGALAQLRGAVCEWSSSQMDAHRLGFREARVRYVSPVWRRLAGAAAMVILFLAASLLSTRFRPAPPALSQADETALLAEIRSEVARTAPSAMQPLTKLTPLDVGESKESE